MGCGEESHPTSSVCMVPKPPGLSSTSGPHSPLQCSPRTKPLRACNKIAIQVLTWENNSLNRSWPYRGQNDSTATYNSQITREKHSQAIVGKQYCCLGPLHTVSNGEDENTATLSIPRPTICEEKGEPTNEPPHKDRESLLSQPT